MRFIKLLIAINLKVFTRPTKYFLLIIFTLFALFIQAYMHNYNIVYIVLFFIFSIAVTSCTIGRFNLYPIKLRFITQQRGFATHPFELNFELLNPNARYYFDIGLEGQKFGTLLPDERKIIALSKLYDRRGEYRLDRVELFSNYPFGHVKFYKRLMLNQPIYVYPEPKGRSLFDSFLKNIALSGQRDDFDGLREYQESDSMALIHWASIAKGEKLSKKYIHTKEDIFLHFYYEEAGKEKEARLSQLTLWVLEASKAGVEFMLHLPNETIYSKKEDIDAILKKLSLY